MGKIPWRRDRLPTSVFLGFSVAQMVKNPPARESPGERSLAGHSPWGHRESDMTEHWARHSTCKVDTHSYNGIQFMNTNWQTQFSHSVMSDSLQPHGLQHARLHCSSQTPRACSNSCPSSWWYHLILCHPLLLLPSIFPSIRVFSSE